MEREGDLVRAIFGNVLFCDGQRSEIESIGEFFAEGFGEICHFVPGLGAFFKDPSKDLSGTELFFAEFVDEYRFEFFG